jgi:hypothetical protein
MLLTTLDRALEKGGTEPSSYMLVGRDHHLNQCECGGNPLRRANIYSSGIHSTDDPMISSTT